MKVINNDDLLDKWIEKITKEAESRAKKNDNSNTTTRRALDHEEVILFDDADDDYYDEFMVDGEENDYEFQGVDYE